MFNQGLKLALALGLTVGGMFARAQETPFSLKVDVDLVSLDAVVLDSSGRPVLDLQKADFAVYDNGEPQEVSHFSPASTPFSLLFLFQNTRWFDSMPFLADVVNGFIGAVRDGDRIAVTTFDRGEYKKVLDWRIQPPEKPKQIVVALPTISSHKLYDTLQRASGDLAKVSGRKGVIVLTDGRDESFLNEVLRLDRIPDIAGDAHFQKTSKALREGNSPFYFVVVNAEPDSHPPQWITMSFGDFISRPGEGAAARDFRVRGQMQWNLETWRNVIQPVIRTRIEQLADASSGRVFYVKKGENVGDRIGQVVRELGTSYSLEYYPSGPQIAGASHRVEVRTRQNDLHVVQSRSTYISR